MKSDEISIWYRYAQENREAADVLFRSGLFNPCLQNVHQFYEKMLKALLLSIEELPPKTHSIAMLFAKCQRHYPAIHLDPEEVAFLDSIYIPSKYPAFSVLPQSIPIFSDCEPWIKKMSHFSEQITPLLRIS